MKRIGLLIVFLGFVAAARAVDAPPSAAPSPPGVEFFESKIRPVLVEQCYKCHSAGAEKLKGKLHLDTREGILKGGESDLPAVVPGNLDDSTLIRAIRYEDEGLRMPPKQKLSAEQVAAFEAWVKMGAPYPAGTGPIAAAAAPAPTSRPVAMSLEEGRKFWSFVPPKKSPPPEVSAATTKPNDVIDRFIVAKLAEKKLAPAPPADKRTLIRRATFDLTGLPPTIAEIEAFEKDPSPDAFAKVIDRLLASPRYGERWGRFWLDVARYADTKGYVFEEERRYAFSYTYRDWVIRALNEDLRYDQFLIQQIAADRLDLGADKRPLAALGFLTLGRRFLNNPPDIIDDRIDVVCRGTMALTVSCARCHDHKYDPIPTADYYSLYGVFASSHEPAELPLIGGVLPAQAAEFEKEVAKRKDELATWEKKRFDESVAFIHTQEILAKYLLAAQKAVAPHPIAEEFEVVDDTKGLSPWMTRRWEAYLKTAADRKDDVFAIWRRFAAIPPKEFAAKTAGVTEQCRAAQTENPVIARFVVAGAPPKSMQEVATRYAAALLAFDAADPQSDPAIEAIRLVLRSGDSPYAIAFTDAQHLFGNVDRMKRRGLQAAIDTLVATHPGSPQRAMAMEDLPQAVEPHIFLRGNAANVGKEVPRQFLAILSPDANRKPFTQGSGRLELAKLVASKDNPLTARVIVNRVWQHHFGFGLVRTPSDFGTRGQRPTHPELLDWLARTFVDDDGWSLKKLHKRIMLSAAYQQSSIDNNPAARQVDPENRLLWHFNPQRLDFESMRDSLLATAGTLDLTMGGRSVDLFAEPFVPRRSVYAFIDRQNLPGTFRTFDFASPDSTSAQRFATSVPQQALYMMNSPFVIEQAKKVMARKEIAGESDPTNRVKQLYRCALGREATKEEIDLGVKFVANEEAQKTTAIAANPTPWSYGFGLFDDATQHLANFYPLPVYTGSVWQGAEKLPAPQTGWAMLSAAGGHAGNDQAHAVVRRWTAPRDCTITVDGTLTHPAKEGDGVRARLVSTHDGLLASWLVHRKSAQTRVTSIAMKQGETIDFLVDCGPRGDFTYDGFEWKVTLTKEPSPDAAAGDDAGGTWNSAGEFTGPDPKPPTPLNAWEKYAQVLLMSNEFAFVE